MKETNYHTYKEINQQYFLSNYKYVLKYKFNLINPITKDHKQMAVMGIAEKKIIKNKLQY